jgi:isocitrate dehydrogenase (NAD+)
LIVRENTEGEPTGIQYDEREKVESVKIVTREAALRIAEFAFYAASGRARRNLVVAHKADVMTKADGLFLRCCREVSKKHPAVAYREMLVNDCCMELVLDPTQFDVLLLQNLAGDIVSGLCAGLVGGSSLAPSASIGEKCAIFEVMHGYALDIADKGIANPTALILSGVLLLRHVNLEREADRIELAVRSVIRRKGAMTQDLGDRASTSGFTDAVIEALREPARESVLPNSGASRSKWSWRTPGRNQGAKDESPRKLN